MSRYKFASMPKSAFEIDPLRNKNVVRLPLLANSFISSSSLFIKKRVRSGSELYHITGRTEELKVNVFRSAVVSLRIFNSQNVTQLIQQTNKTGFSFGNVNQEIKMTLINP